MSCKATLKRKIDGTFVLGRNTHTHDPNPNNKSEISNIRKKLMERAVNETTLLRIIYDQEDINYVNTFSIIKSNNFP